MEPLVALIASAALACLLAPPALRDFTAHGWTRANWRGRELPFPAGAIAVGLALVALAPLAALDALAGWDVVSPTALALALGVTFLGLLDDLLDAPARGMRGHGRAVLRGAFSTGALKAVGTLALALAVLSDRTPAAGEYLLAVSVVVLCTNMFNLLDLRPGRAAKAFVLVGLALLVATRDLEPLRALGVLIGPLLVLGWFDLRERAMLGDAGSNLLGVLAGLWIVTALGVAGQLAALAALVALTAYGELRSISRTIDAVGPLRALDRLGRVPEPAPGGRPGGARPQGAGGS
jgi:UDP-GlcNAc:undecaprenyl-phosphate GlcNAc-1-phosphate transferase